MNDPHIKARQMVVDIDHPKIGPMKAIGLPLKSTGDLTAIRAPAPWLGQHSEEILRGMGYAPGEIDTLFQDGVTYDSDRAAAARTD
jgi:crotonobetainyl-CoA:carnitine CoA-transferase CaiB-like acyl-CoA transferase